MSTSKSCHFCGKNIVKEFDALNDNVNRSNEEVTKETDEKITTKRDGESKCDKCGMECCSAAHLNLLHNRRPADAFVGGKKALEMLSPEPFCFPIKVQQAENHNEGRIIRATTDISAGDIIFEDYPFEVGPFTVSQPVCLVCNSQPLGEARGSLACEGTCGFLVCKDELPCIGASKCNWHVTECKLLKDSNLKFAHWIMDLDKPTPVYSFVTPLRVVLKMLFKPHIYRDLFQIHRLEHHKEHRKKFDPKSWQFHQKFVVDRIKTLRPQIEKSLGKYITAEQEKNLDDLDNIVHEAVCRLRTNTLQLNTDNNKLRSAMGLYPIYSLLNHSCLANSTTQKFPSKLGFKILVKARVDIKNGEEITTQYMPTTSKGTYYRRKEMEQMWCFRCSCVLCKDPTEAGTMFSALKCPVCDGDENDGHLLPMDSLNPDSTWRCKICNFTQTSNEVMSQVNEMEGLLDSSLQGYQIAEDGDAPELKKTLLSLQEVFHENHFLIVRLKQKLGVVLGNKPGCDNLESISKELIMQKLSLCQDVIKVKSKLEKGSSGKWKNMIDNEINKCLEELSKRAQ